MCEVTADASVTLSKSLQSPALARDFVEQNTCPSHGGRGAVALQLLASELVTNAVLYGDAPIQLEMSCSTYEMRLEVHDRKRTDEAPPDVLGFLLVDKVAHEWGTAFTPTGKTVWCSVRTGVVPESRPLSWQRTLSSRATRPTAKEAGSTVGPPPH